MNGDFVNWALSMASQNYRWKNPFIYFCHEQWEVDCCGRFVWVELMSMWIYNLYERDPMEMLGYEVRYGKFVLISTWYMVNPLKKSLKYRKNKNRKKSFKFYQIVSVSSPESTVYKYYCKEEIRSKTPFLKQTYAHNLSPDSFFTIIYQLFSTGIFPA